LSGGNHFWAAKAKWKRQAKRMPPKILITPRTFARDDDSPLDILRQAGCEAIRNPHGRVLDEEQLAALIPGMTGLIVGLDPVSAEVLNKADRLRVVSKYGVGTDNIDLAAATRNGIIVVNAAGSNSSAVAELAFGLMLAVARHISVSDRCIRQGRWESHKGSELWGKTLGIIGTGRTGRELALRARGFEMRLICCDAAPDSRWSRRLGATYRPLNQVLAEADVVSLHIPLTAATRHIISSAELARMQRHAILINTARGELVDEQALLNALEQNRLAGAGLDVWESQPPVKSALCKLDNTVLTSHIGAHTREATAAMGELAARNLVSALGGELPESTVNPEVGAVLKTR
jgi:D-3-phosphoglycerate dehydrogenase